MTDHEYRRPRVDDDAYHHDGVIQLGGHAQYVEEMTGKPTRESYPTSFFEVEAGSSPTDEQVLVLRYFDQELRTMITRIQTPGDVLTRLWQKLQTSDADSYRDNFRERVAQCSPKYQDANFFVGEAQELLKSLEPTIQRITQGEVQMISPEERQELVRALQSQLAELRAKYAELKEIIDSGDATPEQRTQLSPLDRQINYLTVKLDHYRTLTHEEVQDELVALLEERDAAANKVKSYPRASYVAKLESIDADLAKYTHIGANYAAYAAEQRTQPIISAEAASYLSIHAQIVEAVNLYTRSEMDGEKSLKERLEEIMTSQEAQAVIGAGSGN